MLKIEAIGQIDFSADRLLLKQSENMSRTPVGFLLQPIVSERMLIGWCNMFPVDWNTGCQGVNCSELCLKSGVTSDSVCGSKLYY